MQEKNNIELEDWQLDFEWLQIRHLIKENMGQSKLPDLNAVLLLIGIQELGRVPESFTKEEKQDLMHVAVCELLSQEGVYQFVGRDDDGWPHYKKQIALKVGGVEDQERLLKINAIRYFEKLKQTTL